MFWELNVPDVQERSRLKILELLTYKEQAEGLARDLSDFLTNESFPLIRGLGPNPKPSSLLPETRPVQARLGSL